MTTTTIVPANIVQNAARKPFISAISCSWIPECSVTDDAIAAVTAKPTELPNCATTLKTAPASDCVSPGNASDMTRLDTVNRTMTSQKCRAV